MFDSLKWVWLSAELVHDCVSEIQNVKVHSVKPKLYLYWRNDYKPQLSFPTQQHVWRILKMPALKHEPKNATSNFQKCLKYWEINVW